MCVACRGQRECDLKARLVRNAFSYGFTYGDRRDVFPLYCDCSFFFCYVQRAFFYFQFCGFIVASATKYKHSVCRCPRAILNIRKLKRAARISFPPVSSLRLSLASEIFHFSSRSSFYELFTYLLATDASFRRSRASGNSCAQRRLNRCHWPPRSNDGR